MKPLFILLTLTLLAKISFSQNELTGKVTGKDNAALAGATVYIPDLKVGGATNADGVYDLKYLPHGTFLVQVKLIGYAETSLNVKVEGEVTQDFALTESYFQTPEVVVTGNLQATSITQNPQPTSEISAQYLEEHSCTNVIDALALAPGVSAMTDGQSISKPVIRGLGWSRVMTLNDGVIQVDQIWFDEFGIEADPDAVDRAEILKGPASLAYGSDAIGGVVNLIPEQALPEGQIHGQIMSNFQSNNGLFNNMFEIGGTNSGISWSARTDYTLSHAYQNAYDGYALNTQFNNYNADGTIGVHRKRGYTQLHFSYFELQTGIVDGTRDSAGNQLRAVAYNNLVAPGSSALDSAVYVEPTKQEAKSYTPFVIYQRIRHDKLVWDNSLAVGQGRITGIFSLQQNQRQETNDPTMPNTPDIYYFSRAATYDVRYISQNWNGFDFSVGANGLYQASQSLGTLQLIPNYNIFSVGAFAIANYKYKHLTLSGGVRFDDRIFTGKSSWIDTTTQEPTTPNAINGYHEFTAFKSNFKGPSGSIGATYNFNHDFYIKANLATGFRAPNVAECGANGVHDGTVVWEIGDHNLVPEKSVEGDLAVGKAGKDVSFELDGFVNSIQDFIYAHGLQSTSGGDSINNTLAAVGLGAAPVYKDTQGVALLYGGEATLDIHPSAAPWIALNTSFSYVGGGLRNVPDSVKVLPFVPPGRLIADLRFNLNKFVHNNPMDKVIKNSYIKFGFQYDFEQKQIYEEYAIYNGLDALSTPQQYAASKAATPSFILFNLGAGGDIVGHASGRTLVKIYFLVNNLFNTTYMDYMSRFKYYAVNPATGRVGVFNMGRNMSIKLVIPLDFKKA